MITVDRLRELFHYDPATGVFRWAIKRRKAKIGDIVGTLRNTGYGQIGIDNRVYLAHRLAWFYVYGEWPKSEIDHLDGDPRNNRIENLRDVTASVNRQNQRCAKSTNRIGLLGVSRRGRKFQAVININGRNTHIGYFDTPDLAHIAYLTAKRTHHPGNTL